MVDLTIELLKAGACFDGATFLKCALNPLECTSQANTYRTSKWLALNDNHHATTCASQERIRAIRAMGRCNAKTDKYICTSDMSACQLSGAWKPFDQQCTVVDDFQQREYSASYFGECLDRTSDNVDYCAWQSSECPAEGYRFQWANPFFASNVPDCRCDDVKTGACVSDLNPSSDFFCAATEEICADEVGMSYRKVLEVESELGVTCKLCDKLPPPAEVKIVAAGACAIGATFKRCALIPSNCGTGEKYLSAASILNQNINTPEAADVCTTPDGVKNINVGRCDAKSNFHMCVPNPSACNLPQYFKANDPDCTVAEEKTPNPKVVSGASHYGFCSLNDQAYGIFNLEAQDSYCVWSNQDCSSSSSDNAEMHYYDASPGISATQPPCHCDDVRTGACIHKEDPSQRHCAVAEEACENTVDWTFVNWRVIFKCCFIWNRNRL